MTTDKRTLLIVIIVYSIIIIASIPIYTEPPYESYRAEVIGPLPKGYSGILHLLDYDKRTGDALFKINTINGSGLLLLYDGNVSFTPLNEIGDPRRACILNDTIYMVVGESKYNILKYKINDKLIYIYELKFNKINGRITYSRLECNNSPVLILTISNKTIILKIDFQDPIDPRIEFAIGTNGSLIDSAVYQDRLFVALNLKDNTGEILVLNSKNGSLISSFLLPPYFNMNINKIIYTNDLYILGTRNNSAVIYSPRTCELYKISYGSVGKTRVETATFRQGRLVTLVRPPASWMQIAEIQPEDKYSNVEIFSPYMYSFLDARATDKGRIDIMGIIYNNTERYISVLQVNVDKQAMIGRQTTLFVIKTTQNNPIIDRFMVKYEPTPLRMGKIDGNIQLINIKNINSYELNVTRTVEYEEDNTINKILTITALITPLAYITYASIVSSTGIRRS